MNKLLQKVAKLFLGISMAAGVGVAIGASRKDASPVSAADVTDEMTASDLAATGTGYTAFSGVSLSSSAVYAGSTALNNGANIQIRSSSSNTGIFTTASGGTLKSVTITVASGSNTIQVFGKNSAYSQISDLYSGSAATKGTLVGSRNSTGTITASDDYTFIGIRSSSGACYLSKIEIVWTTAESTTPSISFSNKTVSVEAGQNYTQTATTENTGSNAITYSITAGGSYATINSSTGQVSTTSPGSVTVQASVTVNGETYSDTYTLTVTKKQSTTSISASKATLDSSLSPLDSLTMSATVTETTSGSAISQPTVTYTASPAGKVTINGSTITAVANAFGTVTITGTFAETSTHLGSTDTVNITVSDPTALITTFVAGTDVGTSTGQNADSMSKGPITIRSTKAALAQPQYRLYKDSTNTIASAGANIVKVVFIDAQDSSYPATTIASPSTGTLTTDTSVTPKTVTWTGSASSFTVKPTAQARVAQIVVYLEGWDQVPSIDIGSAVLYSDNLSIEATLSNITGTPTWNALPSTGVTFGGGTTTTMTVSNTVANATVITVTASINNTTSNEKHVVVSRNSGTSKNTAFEADEATARTLNELFSSETTYYAGGYVKKVEYSSSNYFIYITTSANNSEIPDNQCLELYHPVAGTGVTLSNISSGDFIYVSGTLQKYGSQAEFAANCEVIEVVGPEITALSVDASGATTEFDIHSTFSSTGIVVTGTVNSASVSIPSADYSVTAPDMDTAGQKSVTVTYTGSTYSHSSTVSTTYNITVIVPSPSDTIDLINAIGTVEYTSTCHNNIVAARNSYNGLPAESQALVTNYQDLEDAEDDWDDAVLAAVLAVEDLIDDIGTVTLSSGSAIIAAETAYGNLLAGDLGKSLVSNYSTLTTARSTYDALVSDRAAADAVEALISALPDAANITNDNYHEDIVDARAAYEALNDKTMVSQQLVDKLVACETKDAQFVPTATGTYEMVDDLSVLVNGAIVLITNADGTVAMSTTQNNNNRGQTLGAASANGIITVPNEQSEIQAFRVETYDSNGDKIVAFKAINGSSTGYIYAAGTGTNNYLRTHDTVDDASKFTITLSAGVFDAQAASNNRNYLRYNSGSSIFSCYNDTQAHIALYIKQVVDPDAVASVSLNASTLNVGLGSTVQLEATIFPDTALDKAVTWSSSDSTIASVSNTGVVTGVAIGGPVDITVTTHDGNKTATCAVTVVAMEYGFFYKITSASELNDGDQIYFDVPLANDAGHKGVNNLIAKKVETTSLDSGSIWSDTFGVDSVSSARVDKNHFLWNVEKDSSSYSFIDTNGDYLGMPKDGTDVGAFDSSEKDATCNWTLNSGSVGGEFLITNGSHTSRSFGYQIESSKLGAYANSNFAEGSTTYRTVDIYKLVTITNADRLSGLTCSGEGSYQGDWSSLSTAFSQLSIEVRAYYKHATYLTSGTGLETVVTATNNTDATIAAFVAKYDYIVSKYHLTDFIGRNPTPNSGANPLIKNIFGKNTNTVAIIVIISMVSVTAIGGYFFLRKRKEEN